MRWGGHLPPITMTGNQRAPWKGRDSKTSSGPKHPDSNELLSLSLISTKGQIKKFGLCSSPILSVSSLRHFFRCWKWGVRKITLDKKLRGEGRWGGGGWRFRHKGRAVHSIFLNLNFALHHDASLDALQFDTTKDNSLQTFVLFFCLIAAII